MSHSDILAFVDNYWEKEVMPTLKQYVAIPCLSVGFDKEWKKNGHIDKATNLFEQWLKSRGIEGLTVERLEVDDRTPLLYVEIPGELDQSVLFYGHLDKQPENSGWDDNKGPWQPVVENNRLYGRGSADDGYAMFSAITAIVTAQAQGIKHGTIKMIIEASEESGSPDLATYIKALEAKIGTPDVVVVLDSGCGNYDQLWCTTSLRGMLTCVLKVKIMEQGVHSGDASGIVPSTYRILRRVMGRLEEEDTGELKPDFFYVDIPEKRVEEASLVAKILGDSVYTKFNMVEGARPVNKNETTLILNRTWRPTMCVIGMDGIPSVADGGNVLRPYTNAKLSFRLPPTANVKMIKESLEKLLLEDPPYNAEITLELEKASAGWNANEFSPWLRDSLARSSQNYFGNDVVYMGEGGSIPLLGMLAKKFPEAQMVVTGVLGPNSNAHGPNEFLDLPMVKKVTASVASMLIDQGQNKQ